MTNQNAELMVISQLENFRLLSAENKLLAFKFVLALMKRQVTEAADGEVTPAEVKQLIDRLQKMKAENRRGLLETLSDFSDLMEEENQ